MLKENNKVLKCSNASPDWRGYVDFVNNVVVDGMSRVICASLEYLLDQVRLTYSAGYVGLTSTYTKMPPFEVLPRFGGKTAFKHYGMMSTEVEELKTTTLSPEARIT